MTMMTMEKMIFKTDIKKKSSTSSTARRRATTNTGEVKNKSWFRQECNYGRWAVFYLLSLFVLLLCGVDTALVVNALQDENGETFTVENCISWASMGECDSNPGWMLVNCQKQCEDVAAAKKKQASSDDAELAKISSFYDLSANDIDGNMIEFTKYKGKVVVITNVASYCGYTDQHYKELITLYGKFKDTGKFEILAFPCNQFGEQEPEKCDAIKEFTNELGVEFQMMNKIDVNGSNTHLVYKYLKQVAEGSPSTIQWNFATYYVINADASSISAFSGVSPMRLQGKVKSLLKMASESTSEL